MSGSTQPPPPTTSTNLEYRHPDVPPPLGRVGRWWVDPWPWWAWGGVYFAPVLVWQVLLGPFDPGGYYMFPVGALYISALVTAAVLPLRLVLRHRVAARHGINPDTLPPESGRIMRALTVLIVYCAFYPVPIRLAAAVRWAGLESLRADVTQGAAPAGPVWVTPFRFTDTEPYDGGVVVLYTEGTRGSFPGSGSGLLYVPAGADFPGYNRGDDGWLVGRWYWFTTD